MKHSESLSKLAPALVAAQGDLSVIPQRHEAKAGSFSYTYASLPDLWECARPILSKHGLAVVQTFEESDGATLPITTMLLHTSGEWISGTLSFTIHDSKPQALGSLCSYGRRYSFAAVLGLVSESDDDAQAAMPREPAKSSGTQAGKRQSPPEKPQARGGGFITEPQRRRLIAIASKRAEDLGDDGITGRDIAKEVCSRFEIASSKDISTSKYDEIVKLCEEWDGPLDA